MLYRINITCPCGQTISDSYYNPTRASLWSTLLGQLQRHAETCAWQKNNAKVS